MPGGVGLRAGFGDAPEGNFDSPEPRIFYRYRPRYGKEVKIWIRRRVGRGLNGSGSRSVAVRAVRPRRMGSRAGGWESFRAPLNAASYSVVTSLSVLKPFAPPNGARDLLRHHSSGQRERPVSDRRPHGGWRTCARGPDAPPEKTVKGRARCAHAHRKICPCRARGPGCTRGPRARPVQRQPGCPATPPQVRSSFGPPPRRSFSCCLHFDYLL